MAKVTLKADVTLNVQQFLDGVAQLDTPDLENIYTRIGLILENRKGEPPAPYTLSVTEEAVENSPVENIPIVETLIPKSISFG